MSEPGVGNEVVHCHLVRDKAEMLEHLDVRWDVFVVEQEVPPVMEIDGRDYVPETLHLVATVTDANGDESVIGAARLVADGTVPPHDSENEDDAVTIQFHVGRVAVREEWRGKKIGQQLMRAAERVAIEDAKDKNATELSLILDAQVSAEGFYTRLGYVATDTPTFYDAGIVHQEMSKSVSL